MAFQEGDVGVPPLAEQDDRLAVGLGERVRAGAGADDEGAVHGGAQEGAVRVPPQRALLPGHAEPVRVAAARPDRALRHHRRAVRPRRAPLEHAVPACTRRLVIIPAAARWFLLRSWARGLAMVGCSVSCVRTSGSSRRKESR